MEKIREKIINKLPETLIKPLVYVPSLLKISKKPLNADNRVALLKKDLGATQKYTRLYPYDWAKIPNGIYTAEETYQGLKITAQMEVRNIKFIVLQGSICAPAKSDKIPKIRLKAKIKDNILQENLVCQSPSAAASVIMGKQANGWTFWKLPSGKPIDYYRQKQPSKPKENYSTDPFKLLE